MSLKPGVYLNLPEEDYFSAPALGSTDIKSLATNPADWWYSSRHNPHYQQPENNRARIIGRALHCLLLEGASAFEERFVIEPDPADYPEAARTVDDLKRLLDNHGIPFKTTFKKADYISIARENGLQSEVWDLITEPSRRAMEEGLQLISAEDFRSVAHMERLAREHADIGTAILLGLSEVSVFWYREDDPETLLRARLDCLCPGFTLDLKSMSNWQGRSIADAVKREITTRDYDLQRVFYDEAREQLRNFVKAGQVQSFARNAWHPVATDGSPRHIIADIADRDTWSWVWLFYQVRDDKAGKAPILVPRYHEPRGTVYENAEAAIDQALQNYRDYRDRFGLDQPWHHAEPLAEIEDGDLISLQYKRETVV